MQIKTHQAGPYIVIQLSGEVDLHFSPQARNLILQHLKDKQPVLVDLSQVSYIDSSGIASLVEGFQQARTQQLAFGLVGVSANALQVLQLARLDTIFPIKNTINDYLDT